MVCTDRQLSPAQIAEGFSTRIGVARAVRPLGGPPTLENLYDSALIRQNKYTALFTEQAFCVINRCNGSLRFQVPVCATGNTGAQVAVVCA